jgi:hypothetical protein
MKHTLFGVFLLLLPTVVRSAAPVERTFLDIDEIRELVEREVSAMAKSPDFFYSYNVFYANCQEKILPVLDITLIEDENAALFCKLIENSVQPYLLSLLKIDTSQNNLIVQTLITEFFKVYEELHFDVDRIKIAKLFQGNPSVLYRIRRLFEFSEGTLDGLLGKFLPKGTSFLTTKRVSGLSDKFTDFIVYKVLERTLDFLYENPRLFMYTMFEMFERPFEIFTDFHNDMEFITNSFNLKFRSRRLYLLDSLDNLALKSLNIFKNEETQNKFVQKVLQKAKGEAASPLFPEVEVNGDSEVGVLDVSLVTPEVIELFEDVDYVVKDVRENEEGQINYKLINNCVKNSRFKSQSLEKLYCYTIVKEVHEDRYLVETPLYNQKLGRIFVENSEKFAAEFIELEASYFAEESIYNENIFPKFREALETAGEELRRSIRGLRKEFYDDHFRSVKQNFAYVWNKLVNFFWTESVAVSEVSKESFQTNILNFADFTDEIWLKRMESEFLKLDAFYSKFALRYTKNKEQFGRYK